MLRLQARGEWKPYAVTSVTPLCRIQCLSRPRGVSHRSAPSSVQREQRLFCVVLSFLRQQRLNRAQYADLASRSLLHQARVSLQICVFLHIGCT